MDAVQDKLDRLARSGPLSVARALDLANQVADEVQQTAISLEENGEFERAADLYEQVARAFEMVAEKVPSADREQVTALGELWSVKADITRYRVYTAPLGSTAEPGPEPITPAPTPSRRRQDTVPTDRPLKPPTGPLEKPGEVEDKSWTVTPPPSVTGDAIPLPTAMKKPSSVRGGQWSVAQVPPLVDESRTLEAVFKKLASAPKTPATKKRKFSQKTGEGK
jgi:hypothetical protein